MNQSVNTDSKNKQQQETTTDVPPWNGQYKNTVGLKPVLRVPSLALSFCYMTGIMNNRNENVKHKGLFCVLRGALGCHMMVLIRLRRLIWVCIGRSNDFYMLRPIDVS